MQMPPDLVIFDCDGVLVDSETLTNEVMRQSFARYGLTMDLDTVMRTCVGGTISGVFKDMRARGAALPDTWVDDIYQEMFAALAEQVDVIPGVPAMLDVLDRASLPYAVGSNGPHAKMNITLERTGLKSRFEGKIVSREDVARSKPHPDVYLEAARRAGAAPGRTLVVEDSASGAQAGQAAGMTTFGFTRDTAPEVLAPYCDLLFADMSELPALLKL